MHIGIIATGLMGMSLALAIKKKHSDTELFGVEPNLNELNNASEYKVFTGIYSDISKIPECDIFFICSPLNTVNDIAVYLLEKFKNSVVTDISSVKSDICKNLSNYNNFVGGHPMTGSERKGAKSANADIFDNSLYILCPKKNQQESFKKLEDFLKSINQNIYIMSDEEHDKAVAYASHLPYFVACTLVNSMANSEFENIKNITGSGWRDTTRVASSPEDMWKIISFNNKDNILKSLKDFSIELDKTISCINNMNSSEISVKAKNLRDNIINHRMNRSGDFVIEIDIPDEPGILAKIFSKLENINIRNIEIEDSRAEKSGSLRIWLKDEISYKNAKKILIKTV
ncbi:MAG: prephenate dehydrogenase/arogenate dehydrogenase family protein [Candidatus Muirbacterium halophilum]|nr:prephenate dehydrogenase/arogenate dehydrogenase family protein [Candidatus Muirbacterium halophilum]MCK9474860.1 prephenate dehydrogenase/arogenate dehydrogenase family protein [Candidatus Muirbacterium halophilum]